MGADSLPDEVDGLLALAAECSLSMDQGRERIGRIAKVLAGWRDVARWNRTAEHEIRIMAESIEPRLETVAAAV